mmetsp:Transcript_17099/g.45517  ORF Transcript_17099/g.45517 Transcript_17099/m.45517 type:complete len:578 (+) Transcript_17099:116-1849(+)
MTAVALALLGALAAGAAAGEWVQPEADAQVYRPETSTWALGRKPAAQSPIELVVSLRLQDSRRAELERVFWEVSDPAHPRYGRHWAVAEITELLAVPAAQVQLVSEYFSSHGAWLVREAPNRDMLTVTMPVQAAEKALNTTIHEFTHREHTHVRILRATRHYALPADVAELVSMVGELLQFPRLRSKDLEGQPNVGGSGQWPNACSTRACAGLVTPEVLATRYKLPNASTAAAAAVANSMAVAEFQGQYYEPSDLTKFSSACHRDVEVAHDIGTNRPSGGIESELDIEYIRAIAPTVPLTVVYNAEYSLLKWANEITSMSDSPLVHSVSYGNDEVQQTSKEYMYTCNTAFMKAGVRGLSILFASGDQGVCGRSGCGIFIHSRFHPDFPAASPYITAVGGTDFEGAGIGPETAWSASGGGFSDTFDIPAYQEVVVAAYKADPDADLPPQKFWNNTGRGYPDVAALGGTKTPYCVATGGAFTGVAGTSASSPVVAGVFARLNGLRLAAGRPPLGFLNPFLYKNPGGFQDVTSGVNGGGKAYGFKAIKGWDPATGLGTPDFEALSKAVMGMEGATDTIVV